MEIRNTNDADGTNGTEPQKSLETFFQNPSKNKTNKIKRNDKKLQFTRKKKKADKRSEMFKLHGPNAQI